MISSGDIPDEFKDAINDEDPNKFTEKYFSKSLGFNVLVNDDKSASIEITKV